MWPSSFTLGGDEETKQGFISQLPAKQSGTSDEIASTILLLASNEAKYINGA
jgi:NAD(P)-dependent dehydrogenase (short-subunit alcohol dehydrogenase family)